MQYKVVSMIEITCLDSNGHISNLKLSYIFSNVIYVSLFAAVLSPVSRHIKVKLNLVTR